MQEAVYRFSASESLNIPVKHPNLMLDRRYIGYGLLALGAILVVLLIFIKADMDEKSVFLCEAVEANPEMTMEECPAHQSGISWVLMFSFGIASLIFGMGIYLMFNPLKKQMAQKVQRSKLGEDEQIVYDLLKDNEGSMYQSELVKSTGFSKVKMTRTLDRLEQKKIVDRKRRGMTNIVVLK